MYFSIPTHRHTHNDVFDCTQDGRAVHVSRCDTQCTHTWILYPKVVQKCHSHTHVLLPCHRCFLPKPKQQMDSKNVWHLSLSSSSSIPLDSGYFLKILVNKTSRPQRLHVTGETWTLPHPIWWSCSHSLVCERRREAGVSVRGPPAERSPWLRSRALTHTFSKWRCSDSDERMLHFSGQTPQKSGGRTRLQQHPLFLWFCLLPGAGLPPRLCCGHSIIFVPVLLLYPFLPLPASAPPPPPVGSASHKETDWSRCLCGRCAWVRMCVCACTHCLHKLTHRRHAHKGSFPQKGEGWERYRGIDRKIERKKKSVEEMEDKRGRGKVNEREWEEEKKTTHLNSQICGFTASLCICFHRHRL